MTDTTKATPPVDSAAAATAEQIATDEGFPVTVQLDGVSDGPVTLSYDGRTGPNTYTAKGGKIEVHNRARLAELIAVGARRV